MQKILIVEDDEKLRGELEIFLNNNGYKAKSLNKFDNTIEDILSMKADLLLLDINLPGADGEYVCKEIRKVSTLPIIIITSRDNDVDELLCLNYGADHYVTKPFNIQILLAKISTLLKRSDMGKGQDKIDCGEFTINLSNSTIIKDDKEIELTKNEIKILKYLAEQRNKIVSREDIMDSLWESESFIDDNTLTVNITRLRNKLEKLDLKELLETKRGQGYILKRGQHMKFSSFLKDKILQISLILFGIITIEIFLLAYPFDNFLKVYIPVILITLYAASIIIEYLTKKHFYKSTLELLDKLDGKYLLTEIIKNPNFIEGKILIEILEQTNKSMIENVNKYKYEQEDYKDYIEMWIHEIKIPIAASKLIIENNKNDATRSIDEELDKIEDYVEQTLFYARSNTANQDYFIKKNNLKDIVNECIKKNKSVLIGEKILINTHDLNFNVNTDSKWVVFILNQIIQNSIKYRKKENSEIEIFSKQGKENITLFIKDNGLGIRKAEISKVFDKGFTGTNGRMSNKKSTGIGLYLCKKLCHKLDIGLELDSLESKGTEVRLVFPNSSHIDMK